MSRLKRGGMNRFKASGLSLILLGVMASLIISGCVATHHKIIKIPRTPENLQAYRECQRTLAIAHGYDEVGYAKLFSNCLNTLESTEQLVEIASHKTPDGCEKIFVNTMDIIYYYLCK